MNLNDLEIFEAIIETGSLNKAAKALGYAQSNISARLKSLEHEFHTTLVERSAKGVEPTRIGKRLYRASLRITAELDDVRREAAGAPGNLLITETLLHYMMTNMPSFHPESYGTIVVRRQSEIVPEARRHQYKSVVAFVDLGELDNYQVVSAGMLEASYLAAEDGTKGFPAGIPLLINHDKECAFRKRSLRDHIDTHDSRRLMEVDSLETIVTMVEQGKGIALLPSYLTEQRKLRKIGAELIHLQYRVYGEVE
ncbi:LysR family transcriptional regulator [Bifidobacterium sp. ESL0784]|uniref:LysR family transcriptional regulator n=1 Tax=Bifidobacterium sp. ESL0784 TaxID=2983231 RepID=UPI0023F6ECF4|nr:LysR family transcriptional regulator [Bifidobacterium sp. ESL0784]MDF7640627.1 LysR family transcriptional regulator [Bifidobacterium sp. ESL0784]